VVTPVALALQFTSGVFFVYTDLPRWMQQISAVFPLKVDGPGHAVGLPAGFVRHPEAAGSWELGRVAIVLCAWVVGALVLCLMTFRWTAREDR